MSTRARPLLLQIWLLATLIFTLEYATYVVGSTLLDRALKLGSFAVMLLVLPTIRPAPPVVRLLFVYAVLFGGCLLASLVKRDLLGVAQFFKVALGFALLPLMLTKLSFGRPLPAGLFRLPICVGAVLALQSLVLFYVIFFDLPIDPEAVKIERYLDMVEASYGLFGFANSIGYGIDGSRILRVQSWFLEPSTFGAFLLFPTFTSFGMYWVRRNVLYLIAGLLCGAALILTFSLANYLALLCAGVFLVVTRVRVWIPRSWGLRALIPLVALGVFAMGSTFAMRQAHDMFLSPLRRTRLGAVLGRDPSTQTLLRSTSRVEQSIALLQRNPIGIGFSHTQGDGGASQLSSPNAVLFWMVSGGIPALVALVWLYGSLGFRYCLPLMLSGDPLLRSVAAAFVAATIQGLSYGTWAQPFYLYVVGVLVLCKGAFDMQLASPPTPEVRGSRPLSRLVPIQTGT